MNRANVMMVVGAVGALLLVAAKPDIALLIGVALVYLLPTLVGWSRHVQNVGSVAVINVFLGWTLIGWVVALAMAARTVPGQDRLA